MSKQMQNFYKAITDYRKNLATIETTYTSAKKQLEQYEGSKGYADDLQKLNAIRMDGISEAKEKAYADVNTAYKAICDRMERFTVPSPTTDEINALSALRMIERPSWEQVTAVGKIVSTPLALDVLRETARNCGYVGVMPKASMTSTEATKIFTTAYKSATDAIDQLSTSTDHAELYKLGKYSATRFDRDFDGITEFLSMAGNCSTEDSAQAILMLDSTNE